MLTEPTVIEMARSLLLKLKLRVRACPIYIYGSLVSVVSPEVMKEINVI